MKPGDYKEKRTKKVNGKDITVGVIPYNGDIYEVELKGSGQGGFARIHRAFRQRDGRVFAFKEFINPKDEQDKLVHARIKGNIKNLLRKPLTEADKKTPLKYFVPPAIGIVELPESNSFGYFMEFIDTKQYSNKTKHLFKKETMPDAKALCGIVKSVSHVFYGIHNISGYFYKDINTGNIYINTNKGEALVADADNISASSTIKTVKGTPHFMAPEVLLGETPDGKTDLFSLAVYFYYIIIGGYPLEGVRTEEYYIKNDKLPGDAATDKLLYATNALFAFDPNDKSNRITDVDTSQVDESTKGNWKCQANRWDALPQQVKDEFIKTFTEGLKNRMRRTTDLQWYRVFDDLEKNHLVKCSCGKYSFDNSSNCRFCGNKISAPISKPVQQSAPNPAQTGAKPNAGAKATSLNCTFRVNQGVPKTVQLNNAVYSFSSFDSTLGNQSFFSINYNSANKTYTFKNLTNATLHVKVFFFDENNKQKTMNINGVMKSYIENVCPSQNILNLVMKNEKTKTVCRYMITVSTKNSIIELLIG